MDLFSPGFCLCGSVELFLLWKNFLFFSCLSFLSLPFFSDSIFLSFSVHFSQSLSTIFYVLSFLSLLVSLLSSSISHSLSLYVLSFSLLPSLILSVTISALLSMASPLCFPPPVFFSLYSPRMHLFKACFTRTVLKQKQRGNWESCLVSVVQL